MISILIVDDDSQWRYLLSRGLSGYRVDTARSYDDALVFLAAGIPYEVAIVDLNLVFRLTDRQYAEIIPEDRLGADILGELRDNYPTTRRIVITGFPRRTVERIPEQYSVDCILFKDNSFSLADMRAQVKASIDRALADIPTDVRAARTELGETFSKWKQEQIKHFDEVAKLWNDEIDEARSRGQPVDHRAKQLARLSTKREKFQQDCPAFARDLGNARTHDAVAQLAQRFAGLKAVYGS